MARGVWVTSPRAVKIEQSVEKLQEIMAKDAVLLEEADREIVQLKAKLNTLQQKLAKSRRKHEH
jgi:hypothetical protein